MSSVSERYQVIIVGAGPVGLSLALMLALKDYRVLVLEKEAGTAEHSRAPAIWPRTQEILADLGVMDRFTEMGILKPSLEIYDVDRDTCLFRAPLETLSDQTRFPWLLIIPQARTESLLLEALEQHPAANIRFSSEVTELSQRDGCVDVHFTAPAGESVVSGDILVGCDGAHSFVRHAIGAHQEGLTYAMQAALADVRISDSIALHSPRLTTTPGIAVGIRIEEDTWRLILPFAKGDSIPLERRVEEAVENLFHHSKWEPVWRSEFRLHRRISSVFSRGRVVLAGDAAHLNSPVGGQGMNAGIQDASRLAPAIEQALRSDPEETLQAYGDSRRAQIAQGVNRVTDIMTRILLAKQGRFIRLALSGANLALRVPGLRKKILRRMAMLD
ncbi:FAD-dependent oxidoreductase [Microbulbifer rhizosphaerae]|uniref:2-polyprenyl-6-methoxyphenol hydroxylase-like FAD-dependent oxidoreductase n=1 Tax=Microbulbifer rhizosphaerae TaxID=1562603 RepID=A0A7W4WG01_9GAMM|nr:NAD(P)/FAD-dependent oxidoreductase [Microbulbifer rhizosphaerae]MBB3063097.1 2-polyprenyl-6-methoxyphenol hydroxylase-like FAD-dependent oxidoreductase [Microbulbifer rhizosphaerae]